MRAIRAGLTEIRRALQELRAKPLEDLGLALAVKGLAESVADRAGTEIEVTIDHHLGDYPPEIEQCIYRIVQEALVNIVSHAQATRAQVILKLSDREREVLRLLARGLSNAEIGQTLFLSEGTVKNYVSMILSKLGVADRTQAAILAIRAGLIAPGEA